MVGRKLKGWFAPRVNEVEPLKQQGANIVMVAPEPRDETSGDLAAPRLVIEAEIAIADKAAGKEVLRFVIRAVGLEKRRASYGGYPPFPRKVS